MEVLSSRGVCLDCAATDGTAEPTPRIDRSAPFDFVPRTAAAGPEASSGAPTASLRVTAETSEAKPEARPLPEAPAGYEILGPLGHGGMGDVYLAREQVSERLVALKFLLNPSSPDAYDRFVVELRVLAKLDHPNIVRVLSHDFLRAQPYFTMELQPGGSLSRTRDGARSLSPAEAVRLIRLIAGAVAAAHAAGIVHRDLKPSNILLDAAGVPKVADFGLAKRLAENDGLTATTGMLGTPAYMPPEQVSRKNGPIGTWSDVYGLGATLYALLTDRPPFVGPTPVDVVHQVLADAPMRPRAIRPEIPLGLEAVVLKCLAKEPKDRYQTVAELLADLDRYEAGLRPVAPLMTRRRRLKLWVGRNRGALAAAALATTIGVGLVGAGWAFAPVPPLPRPAPAPPDPLLVAQDTLRAGKKVVLVGETGLPKFYQWRFMPSQLGESPQNDRTATFQTAGTTCLELMSDPGIDRYRVTAQLRQLKGVPPPEGSVSKSVVGFYIGHDIQSPDDKWQINTLYAVRFTDCAPIPAPGLPVRVTAQFCDALYTQHPGGLLSTPSWKGTEGVKFKTKPVPEWPGKWRTIQFEVAPEFLRASWLDEETDQFVVAYEMTGQQARARFEAVRARVDRYAPGTGVVPRWHPRLPLGVLNESSTVSLKNVVIEPLP